MGVKGGCSPQNNRKKLSSLVNELPTDRNKFYLKNSRTVGVTTKQEIKPQMNRRSCFPDLRLASLVV